MKKHYYFITLLCLLINFTINSQTSVIISKFSWDDTLLAPTVADIGPNANSISSSAKIDVNGHGGTNGLNAGSPKLDIVMSFANNSIFNVDGIDISIAYQRDEDVGTFFKRGSYFSFLSAANLNVTFRLKDGSQTSGYIIVNSGNVYAIPKDDIFRIYRFLYNQNTGVGILSVDGETKWTYNGTPNQVLDWSAGGNIALGTTMDGSGSNKTFYDEYVFSEVLFSTLPIELISFSTKVNEKESTVDLEWITASETNNDFFTIERSFDGKNWDHIQTIDGAENSTSKIRYNFKDENPLNGISYYRLKQTDFDGKFTYSSIQSVECNFLSDFDMFPNPIHQGDNLYFENLKSKNEDAELLIFASNGILIKEIKISKQLVNYDLNVDLKPGMYFVTFGGNCKKLVVKN